MLGLVSTLGCKHDKRKGEPPASEQLEQSSSHGIEDAVASVGDGAPFVVVLRDDGWPQLREHLKKTSMGLPEAERIVGASNVMELAAALPGFADVLDPGVAWEGRDPTHPVVAALFEPPFRGPPGAFVGAMKPESDPFWPVRHQLVVPATDVDGLVASLRKSLGAAEPAPELVAGLAAAVGLRLSAPWPEQRFAALVPESHAVRLVLFDGARGFETAAPLRPRVETTPTRPPSTPALEHLVAQPGTLAVLVRPWNLRPLAAWLELREGAISRDEAGASGGEMAFDRTVLIAAADEAFMPDTDAELDDWSFVVRADAHTMRVEVVASLAEEGRAVWSSATSDPAPRLSTRDGVVAEASLSFDFRRGFAAAGPLKLGEIGEKEIRQGFMYCAPLCRVFAALRWPAGALQTPGFVDSGWMAFEAAGVRSVQLAMMQRDGQTRPTASFVGTTSVSLSPLLEAVEGLGLEGLEAHQTDVDGVPVLLVGRRIDPRLVFDVSKRRVASAPVELVSHETLEVPGVEPFELRAAARVAGPALAAEIVIGGGAPSFSPSYADLSWESPIAAADPSEAATCLHRAVLAFEQRGFSAVFTPTLNGAYALKTYDTLDRELVCAQRSSDLAEAAAGLRETFWIQTIEAAARAYYPQDVRELLAARCPSDRKDAVCNRYNGATPGPPIDTVRCKLPPGLVERMGVGGSIVSVAGDDVAIAGRGVPSDAASITAALVAASAIRNRIDRTAGVYAIVATRETTMRQLLPAFHALVATRSDTGLLVAPAEHPILENIRLELDAPSPTPVDWAVPDNVDASRFSEPRQWTHVIPPTPNADASPVPATLEIGPSDVVVGGPRGQRRKARNAEAVRSALRAYSGNRSNVLAVQIRASADQAWSRVLPLVIAVYRADPRSVRLRVDGP